MTRTQAAVVRKEVVVAAPIERAFSVFTERFGDFKPPGPGGACEPSAAGAGRPGMPP